MIKYAYNTLVYAGESIEESIKRLAKYEYDGVEFVGEPDDMDFNEIKKLLTKYNIEASSICAIYTPERDLVSSKADIRENAKKYIKKCLDMAAEIGASVMSLTPTACMKTTPEDSLEQEWEWAVEGLREVGKYAEEKGVKIAVEPWNRYENYLINRLDQSIELVDEVNIPSVGCMCDIFHMCIEETDIPAAIRKAGDRLYHIHIADNNRAAPGYGHLDFNPIIDAILSIGYDGYLSMELLPAAADPFLVLEGADCEEFYDQYTKDSIDFLKRTIESRKGLQEV